MQSNVPKRQRVPSRPVSGGYPPPQASVDDEDEESSEGFSSWKSGIVIALVIGCFAIIYPKMFHPMLMHTLGFGSSGGDEDAFSHGAGAGRPPFGAEMPRGGPYAGAPPRMGAPGPGAVPPRPGAPAPAAQTSSWRGFSSMMLPVYSVGVIGFLLYTLSKIIFKKPGKTRKPTARYNLRYNSDRERFEVGNRGGAFAPAEEDEEVPTRDGDDVDEPSADGVLSSRELRSLHARLSETESAMQKIMQQLEMLSAEGEHIDERTANAVQKLTKDTLNNIQRFEKKGSQKSTTTPASTTPAAGSAEYLNDLENALLDFKRFTDDYVAKKQRGVPAESETPSVGFDTMEAECSDEKTTPVGEIITLSTPAEDKRDEMDNDDEAPVVAAKTDGAGGEGVRRRKRGKKKKGQHRVEE